MIRLKDYGFTSDMITVDFTENIARVIAVHKERYVLYCEYGEIFGRLKSSVYYNNDAEDFPTTGDFVLINYNSAGDSQIVKTLERKTKFSRNDFSGHAVGYVKTVKQQVVAANFDFVFIMQSLNHDLNARRLERYLTLAWQSGAIPVVILTKSDLVTNSEEQLAIVKKNIIGCEIHVISAKTGYGLNSLTKYFQSGITIVFLGSSGVGKSSLVNTLAGNEVMVVKEIRGDDSKGRHATTHRQLIMLPNGTMIIDTPGMRELGMWDVTEGVGEVFSDVEQFMGMCRFTDCRHKTEPGCAIRDALESGTLSPERWESYLKIKREVKFAEDKSAVLRNKNARNKGVAMQNKQKKYSKRK